MLLLRSIFYTILLPGAAITVLPYLIDSPFQKLPGWNLFSIFGVSLAVLGFCIVIWCVWDFFSKGKGTLAFIDPPKFLIKRGLYRFVRNPMYLGVLIAIAGEAVFSLSAPLAVYALLFWLGAHLFVTKYEEPKLLKLFGDTYAAYNMTTPRWIPFSKGIAVSND